MVLSCSIRSATLSLASNIHGLAGGSTAFFKIGDEVVSGTVNNTTPTTIDSLTRAVEGSDVAHASGASVEFYMVNGIPLTEVNKTHTQLGNIGIDSYTVATTTAATSDGTTGGEAVTATENAQV